MMTILECTGPGAKNFLQGQLTCNVNDLKENQPQLTACCNLQGRVIFIAYIIMQNEQRFLLSIPESMKNIVISHLEKYARFSKCIIKEAVEAGLMPAQSGQPQTRTTTRDYLYGPTDKKALILNGIPTIYPETSEQIIAQRLNLHLIDGAMNFKKGCYLGQEIIARLHFKGKLKHHMYLGEIPSNTSLHYGDNIMDDKKDIVGLVIDFFSDGDKTLLLFVNTIENKHPTLENGQSILLHSLPYTFRDDTP